MMLRCNVDRIAGSGMVLGFDFGQRLTGAGIDCASVAVVKDIAVKLAARVGHHDHAPTIDVPGAGQLVTHKEAVPDRAAADQDGAVKRGVGDNGQLADELTD